MRRVLAAAAVVALAGVVQTTPATGATTTERSSTSADAFWSKEQKIKTGYRISSWSISAFRGTDGAEGTIYHDVVRCKKRPEPIPVEDRRGGGKRHARGCVVEVSSSGTGDVSGSYFTIDDDGFTSAHVDSTFALQSYDAKGNPKGEPVPTHVVADWTGRGDVARSDGTYNFEQGACVRHETFEDAYREADADGTFGSTDLGPTTSGFLGASSGTSTADGCPVEPGPIPLDAKRG